MKILLPTDDSEFSALAVRSIASRPWPPGAIVRVLSVSQSALWSADPKTLTNPAFRQIEATAEAEAISAIGNATEQLKTSNLVLETKVRRGDPRREILDEAKEWSSDLIVLGSRGRTGLSRWILGSVAEHVVRHAPCSVEVTREKAQPAGP